MGQRGRPPSQGLLTPAEQRVLDHVRQGQTNAEIAVQLGISVNTVRYHVSNLLSKAGVADRTGLAGWKPAAGDGIRLRRPAWWLAGIAAGGIATAGVVGALWLAGLRDGPGDDSLPAGYGVYESTDLEAMGTVDVGPLFVMQDGSAPVVGGQLRDAAFAAVLRPGAQVAFPLDPCCEFAPGATDLLVRRSAPWGAISIAVFSGGTGFFERTSVGRPFQATAPDGRPIAGVRVWNAGRGYLYGDGKRESLPAALDARGHLFVASTPVDSGMVIDERTDRALNLTQAEAIARAWPGLSTDYSEQGNNRCDTDSGACFTGLFSGLRAPVAGRLSCAPDSSTYRLETEQFVLLFSRMMTLAGYPRCTGDGMDREVSAGEEFETAAWWRISAQTPDGRPLDVAKSYLGVLYVGTGMAPDQRCPCVGSN